MYCTKLRSIFIDNLYLLLRPRGNPVNIFLGSLKQY